MRYVVDSGDFGDSSFKVDHLNDTHKTLAGKCKELENYFKKLTVQETQPVYEAYSAEATSIEDDLREANRRKPKKAKAGKAGTENASS